MRAYQYRSRPVQKLILVLLVFLFLTTVANAQTIPDPILCDAVSANSEPVSVMVRPDGGGWSLSNAMVFGGDRTDATITLTLINMFGEPVINYPAEDMFLVSCCDLMPCWEGSIADANTNDQGQTTFSNPFKAGGSGSGAEIMIGTWPTPEFPIPISGGALFQFNSPDMNGDAIVNLTDVAIFAGDYYGLYNYRSDLWWDGVLNLSDIVVFSYGIGVACP